MTLRNRLAVIIPPLTTTLFAYFLWYMTPFSSALLAFSMVYTILLAIFGGVLLFTLKIKSSMSFFVPILLVITLRLTNAPLLYIESIGFYARYYLRGSSTQACNPTSFSSHGREQEIGLCEVIHRLWAEAPDYIVYDTTGELDQPYQARTQKWKDAISSLPNGRVLAQFPHQTRQLFGPFYAVQIELQDADRS